MASDDPKRALRAHLTDQQLAQFQDGALTPEGIRHFGACPQCRARLEDIRAAESAYVEYRDLIRAPLLPPPPRAWRTLDSLIAEEAERRRGSLLRWWPAPALAAALGIAIVLVFIESPARRSSAQATELLEQSSSVELPQGRMISVRMGNRTLIRPAVMISAVDSATPELAHLGRVFATARYSWREPLSPRSFQAWRGGLKQKRDLVSTIEERGRKMAYRVRTESPSGMLHDAAITLRAADLRAVAATFNFEGEGTLDLGDAPVDKAPVAEPRHSPDVQAASVETPAGPADALHVLAALNAIGADAGEPITVAMEASSRSVLVRGSGLTTSRRREIEAALSKLPRVVIDWHSEAPSGQRAQPANPERYSSRIPPALRQQFEDRVGGAVRLQETTDRALDASATALARAHALGVLASLFPIDVEARLSRDDRVLLRTIKRRHLATLARLVEDIHVELKPLLQTAASGLPSSVADNGVGEAWQAGIPAVVNSAQQTDRLVNLLLAGTYPQPEGEAMLRKLALEIGQLERGIERLRQGEQ